MPNTTGRKYGGRKKGTPNRETAKLKDAILKAFDRAGGVAYLETVARDDPKTFCALLGKVLPMQVTGENGGPIETLSAIKLVAVYPDNGTEPKSPRKAG